MSTITFDTYDFIERLKSSGIEETQAKAIADGLKEIDLEYVASKEDIVTVREDMKNLEIRLLKWLIPLFLGQYALLFGILIKTF